MSQDDDHHESTTTTSTARIRTKSSASHLNLDEIFDEIGHLGRYQLLNLILIAFTATIAATNAYSLIFTNAKPDFRFLLF